MVLGVAGLDPALVQDAGAVLRQHVRRVAAGGAGAGVVEVADDHRQGAQAVGGEVGRELLERGPRGVDERRPQREVLHGVAGQHHLGKGHQVRATLGGLCRPPADHRRVAGQVPHRRVDLGQGESQLRHASSLDGAAQAARWGTGGRSAQPRGETSSVCAIVPQAPPRSWIVVAHSPVPVAARRVRASSSSQSSCIGRRRCRSRSTLTNDHRSQSSSAETPLPESPTRAARWRLVGCSPGTTGTRGRTQT